ncbi:hypothetical protein ABIF16_006862 [Bradyrhizobium elkanii]
MARSKHPPTNSETVAEHVRHAGRQNDQTRDDAPSGGQRQLLTLLAAADIGHLVEQEARRIGRQAACHVDEVGIGNPVGPADADIDQLAAPDVEHPVIGRGNGLDVVDEAEAAQNIDLPSGDLLDAEFIRRDRTLVDQDDPVPGPGEHSPCQRTCQTGSDNCDVRFDDFGLAGHDRLGRTFLGNHVCPLRRLERFRAKWIPVRVKKTRQNKNLERRSDSIGTEKL